MISMLHFQEEISFAHRYTDTLHMFVDTWKGLPIFCISFGDSIGPIHNVFAYPLQETAMENLHSHQYHFEESPSEDQLVDLSQSADKMLM
jgi:hypothetical protein